MGMVTLFKRQINLLLLALAFFTRIPIPNKTPYSPELLNKSSRYYAVIGFFIGFILCGILAIALVLFPVELAVILTLIASFIITGAFHEDGFADMCDGFGGGFTPEKKLEIMKDSRVGTYGSIAIVCIIAIMFLTMSYITSSSYLEAAVAMLVGHTLSRALSGSLIFDLNYLRVLDAKAKAKPLSTGIHLTELLILCITGGFVCLLLNIEIAFLCLMLTLIIRFLFKKYLIFQLGGFTGDCLGAAQIISMLSIWLMFTMLIFHHIPWLNPFLEDFFYGLQGH